jgi:hypothetical protein
MFGVRFYPNARKLPHTPGIVHTKLRQRVNDQLLYVIYIGTSVSRAIDTVLRTQTQYGIANQLARTVIRDIATPLHLYEICADICWLAAKVISQVRGVTVSKNMRVLE